MKRSNKELNEYLTGPRAGIRSERVDQSVVESAAERVRAKLLTSMRRPARRCARRTYSELRRLPDLIPEYLMGICPGRRLLLFEDHTHEASRAAKRSRSAITRDGRSSPARRVEDSSFATHGCEMGDRRYDYRRIGVLSLTYERFFNAGYAFHMVVHA